MPDYVSEAVQKIKQQVGGEEVILGLSGGVDSSVAAALVHRAVGDQLTCVFVDHGLLRAGESDQVMETFGADQGIRVTRVDAREQFLKELEGVEDPEEKRRRIGEEFIRVFEDEAKRLGGFKFLAQGRSIPTSSRAPAGTWGPRRASRRIIM